MKFEIKHIEIIDEPREEKNTAQIAQCHVEIGSEGAVGADIFTMDVCNPQWADEHIYSEGAMSHPTVIIVRSIDEKTIREKIERKFLSREYESFHDFVRQAAPVLQWEFD